MSAPALHSVKELLARRAPHLARLSAEAVRQRQLGSWLTPRLPAELQGKVTGVSERAGTLLVFAASAAWCARLRFALIELEPSLRAAHPAIGSIEVRVLPRR
jgi:hypothetical protein